MSRADGAESGATLIVREGPQAQIPTTSSSALEDLTQERELNNEFIESEARQKHGVLALLFHYS